MSLLDAANAAVILDEPRLERFPYRGCQRRTMSQSGLALIDAKTAREVVSRAALSDEALGLVSDDQAPQSFLDLLMEHGLHLDAIRFLAQAVVKRAAVWWALRCVTEVAGPELPAAKAKALEAARAWVIDPSEENRRACWAAAEAAEIGSPAGCTAMAAFFSGGSLSLPDLPAVPPGEDLTGAHGRGRADARGGDEGAREGGREVRDVPADRPPDRRRPGPLARPAARGPRGPPRREETIGDADGTAGRSRW